MQSAHCWMSSAPVGPPKWIECCTTVGDLMAADPNAKEKVRHGRRGRATRKDHGTWRTRGSRRSNSDGSHDAPYRARLRLLQGPSGLRHLLRRVVHRPHLRDPQRPRRSALVLGAPCSQQVREHAHIKPGCDAGRLPRLSSKLAGSSGRRGRGWSKLIRPSGSRP